MTQEMKKKETREINHTMFRRVVTVGDSIGVTLDKKLLAIYGVSKGDTLEINIKRNVVSWFQSPKPFQSEFSSKMLTI